MNKIETMVVSVIQTVRNIMISFFLVIKGVHLEVSQNKVLGFFS